MHTVFFSLIATLGLGFILGIQHALDPDHIVAVSTIANQTKSVTSSSRFGLFWGLGHTTTLLVVGGILLTFRIAIPSRLALGFEMLVGIMLILLGVNCFRKLKTRQIHRHEHTHDGLRHAHFHAHASSPSHRHAHTSFVVGLVHGLAGSAALMLLVLATVQSFVAGMMFIVVFGIGSILSMMIITMLIGAPFVFTKRFNRAQTVLSSIAAVTSICLGLATIYEIAVVQHLVV